MMNKRMQDVLKEIIKKVISPSMKALDFIKKTGTLLLKLKKDFRRH